MRKMRIERSYIAASILDKKGSLDVWPADRCSVGYLRRGNEAGENTWKGSEFINDRMPSSAGDLRS